MVIGVLFISACQEHIKPTAGVQPTEEKQETIAPQIEYGEINAVESIRAVPQQQGSRDIQIVVAGLLPDGCTEVDRVDSVLKERTFTIRIFTRKDATAMCTEALEPFEKTITLQTSGLEDGQYNVEIYDRSMDFYLEEPVKLNDTCG